MKGDEVEITKGPVRLWAVVTAAGEVIHKATTGHLFYRRADAENRAFPGWSQKPIGRVVEVELVYREVDGS